MSERKETPDLLGDILLNQPEEMLESDLQHATDPQVPTSSGRGEGVTQDLVQQCEARTKQLEEEREQLREQVSALNQQLAETQARVVQLESEKQSQTEVQGPEPFVEDAPSSADKVSTLEDQLKQLGRKKRWWQFRKR